MGSCLQSNCGITTPAGDTMTLWPAVGDRYPGRVADPHVLDPAGTENPRVGSGPGPHCRIGVLTARIGLVVGLAAWVGVS